jgi:hypothetical protein
MPDPAAQMSAEEQSYFDTRGEQAPATENVAPVEKEPAPKVTKTKGKAPAKTAAPEEPEDGPEGQSEPAVPAAVPAIVKKTPEQEHIDNLTAALREERITAKERERRTEERLCASGFHNPSRHGLPDKPHARSGPRWE